LVELGGKNQKPYVLFLLTLGEQFSKVAEKKDYHYFWANVPNPRVKVETTLASLISQLQKIGKPVSAKSFFAEVASKQGLSEQATFSSLEISKRIQPNKENGLGLVEWPEIKPRGVKDKAFLVFKFAKSRRFYYN